MTVLLGLIDEVPDAGVPWLQSRNMLLRQLRECDAANGEQNPGVYLDD